MKKLLLYFLLFTTTTKLWAIDIIQCEREKPTTRQFCHIKDTVFDTAIAFPKVATLHDDSGTNILYEVDLLKIFQDASIELINDQGNLDVLLINSLRPKLKFSTNWNNSTECRRSSLWEHDVLTRLKNQQLSERLRQGVNSYAITLANYFTDDFSPITIEPNTNGDKIIMAAEVDFFDATYDPNFPYPTERIPEYCKLDLTSPILDFEATEINDDLSFVKQLVQSKSTIITQATVIHSHIIDKQKGAICSAYTVAQKLKAAELLFPDESFFYLSLESRRYIISLLANAKALGVSELIGVDNSNLLSYLDSHFNHLRNTCLAPELYEVNKERFLDSSGSITNHQGYENAVRFEREIANLKNLLNSTWALVRASEVGSGNAANTDWIFAPDLYVHF